MTSETKIHRRVQVENVLWWLFENAIWMHIRRMTNFLAYLCSPFEQTLAQSVKFHGWNILKLE